MYVDNHLIYLLQFWKLPFKTIDFVLVLVTLCNNLYLQFKALVKKLKRDREACLADDTDSENDDDCTPQTTKKDSHQATTEVVTQSSQDTSEPGKDSTESPNKPSSVAAENVTESSLDDWETLETMEDSTESLNKPSDAAIVIQPSLDRVGFMGKYGKDNSLGLFNWFHGVGGKIKIPFVGGYGE